MAENATGFSLARLIQHQRGVVPSAATIGRSHDMSRTQLNIGAIDVVSTQNVALEPTTLPFPAGLADYLVGSNDPLLIMGGAAVVVLALGAAALTSSPSSKETSVKVVEKAKPEPEPIDVSIPYDAAVILAFKEWQNAEPNLKSEVFAQFKKLYLEKTIAEVTMKEKSRRFEAFISSSSSS